MFRDCAVGSGLKPQDVGFRYCAQAWLSRLKLYLEGRGT